MDILSFFYVELGVQIVSMLGTKSHKLIQIGEERKTYEIRIGSVLYPLGVVYENA